MDTGADAATSAANSPPPGRDGRGRFTKGNGGGPGNPFARHTAALRKAFCEAVREEDIKQMVEVVKLKALGGDLAACKLLLSYCVGRPAPAVEPDTLDEQEYRVYQRQAHMHETMPDVLASITPDVCCRVVRTSRPGIVHAMCGQIADVLDAGHMPGEGPDDDAEPQEQTGDSCRETSPPPSAIGTDGESARTQARPPRQPGARRPAAPGRAGSHPRGVGDPCAGAPGDDRAAAPGPAQPARRPPAGRPTPTPPSPDGRNGPRARRGDRR
jgi:hypothetical protein